MHEAWQCKHALLTKKSGRAGCRLLQLLQLAVSPPRYLLEREAGWDARKEWGEVLSLGEQQRLGMARLFFHRPLFGVLDECTNATSGELVGRMIAASGMRCKEFPVMRQTGCLVARRLPPAKT